MSVDNKSIELVDDYIVKQGNLDTLRFITCGSVDDGKSTLIGRMLHESQMIFEDQVAILIKESKKIGTQGEDIDYALLLDGLVAEREQGITIDVAYRFFSSDNRKFIVADTPGHEQYTKNMVTGASTADCAVILIDARRGVLSQTRRHSILCSIIGIKNIILAINKMDLVNYSEKIYDQIVKKFCSFAKDLNFKLITPIPISALKGDNIVKLSNRTDWYLGPTFFNFLETVDTQESLVNKPLRLPVQWVNRPNQNFRGFSGIIESGKIKVGQNIQILPSGQSANIKEIILYKQSLISAEAGQSITITLDKEIDASRGDLIVDSNSELNILVSDHFELNLIWMNDEPAFNGRRYLMKIGTTVVNAQITRLKHKINFNTFKKTPVSKLEINDLGVITIKTDRPIPFEKYENCRGVGGVILINRSTKQTVAAGMINFALRRAKNLFTQKLDVDKRSRQLLNGHSSKVIWLTGLSGSGKSTIANALEKKYFSLGIRTYVLDGDMVRLSINKDLGFSDADRVENIRRVSEVAKILVDAGILVITSLISPFKADREMARNIFDEDEFIEVFVDTPLEVAELRDPKGLYKKARLGEIPNFTGVDSPYEKPENPDIIVSTNNEHLDAIVNKIISKVII